MKRALVVSLAFLVSCATMPEPEKEHDEIELLITTAAEGDPIEAVVQLNQAWLRARKLGHTGLEAWARATLATRVLELGAPAAAIERDQQVHSQSFDLARAFLLRGSRVVIASLWSMDDDASKIAMGLFHSRLAADQDPIRALRQTALELRSQGKPVRDWAGFIVLGSSPHELGGAG